MAVYGSHLINIIPWMHWKASSTYALSRWNSSQSLSMGYLYADAAGATGKHVEWDVGLVAGTWRLTLIYIKATSGGIITPSLNGVDLATFDDYNSYTTYNNVYQASGIAVASDGVVELKFRSDTKHASSSNYMLYGLQAISLLRTGA